MTGENPVGLFGKRIPFVAAPKSRFNVSHGTVEPESGESACENRGRVSFHEKVVGSVFLEIPTHFAEGPGERFFERLVKSHQIEIHVRADLEEVEYALGEFAMLTGGDKAYREIGNGSESENDGKKLYRLRSRSD